MKQVHYSEWTVFSFKIKTGIKEILIILLLSDANVIIISENISMAIKN